MDKEFILEPLRLYTSGNLFHGGEKSKIDGVELISDLEKSMHLAYEQNIGPTYLVWQDAIENEVSKLRTDKFKEAELYLACMDEHIVNHQKNISMEYRKKKIKKQNTKFDDFYINVIDDVYYQLKMTSISRFINKNELFERIFNVYKNGFFPCGIKTNQTLIALDPLYLK